MNPFSSGRSATATDGETGFDEPGRFVPEHVPDPGGFLEGHDVLEGEAHVAFNDAPERCSKRGRLRRHLRLQPGATQPRQTPSRRGVSVRGRRRRSDGPAGGVQPPTEFCPRTDALVEGSFRAWNGLADRHDYDLVRVRVRPIHHRSESLNETLERLEAQYLESGQLPNDPAGRGTDSTDQDATGDESTLRSPF